MAIKVKTFGKLKELAGGDLIILDHAEDSNELKELLFQKFPLIKGMKFLLTINNKTVTANTIIADGDSVAVLPPFSGG